MSWRRLTLETHTFVHERARWGLTAARRDNVRATRVERRWRWPMLLALVATIPAFYVDLLPQMPSSVAIALYLVAAAVLSVSLGHVASHTPAPLGHVRANTTDLLLIAGLLMAAVLPTSEHSATALALRLGVAFLTLVRMVWTVQHLITRGGLSYLLLISVLVLGACGMGFWFLEPSTPDLPSGLWLAFTTAATVGYGDVVPTTAASKIFAVFVVLLGYGVLTLVTAAIAARWVETEERRLEHEILRDMRREMAILRQELASLREALPGVGPSQGQPVRLDVQQPVEDQ
jgi:voltage-gated potassium channel